MNSYVIYIYLYIYICLYLYIYSHTLKRDKEKDQIFPGNWFLIGELQNQVEKEGTHDSISI